MPNKEINETLLKELKQEEWKKKVSELEYKNNSDLILKVSKKNLEEISSENKKFKPSKFVKTPITFCNVSLKAQEAYHRWKKQNPLKKPCPEVNVQELLLLLHYLNSQSNTKEDAHKECLRVQTSEFDTFWDSPSFILRMLRVCLLQRDWTNMTYFLLILLNYDRKYLSVIRKMCQIMIKFDPLVRECGLETQFVAFSQNHISDEIIRV